LLGQDTKIGPANKENLQSPRCLCRVLVISVAAESSAEYVPMMNCCFLAESKRVTIDALVLGTGESLALEQATSQTDGVYVKPNLGQLLTRVGSDALTLEDALLQYVTA